jgi:hypothetical protein
VSLFTVKLVADTDPKSTAVAAVNPLPVIVTVMPPVEGPLVGPTFETLGVVIPVALVNV